MKINDRGRWEFMGGMNPTHVGFSGDLTTGQHVKTLRQSYTVPEGKLAVIMSMSGGVSSAAAVNGNTISKVICELAHPGGQGTRFFGVGFVPIAIAARASIANSFNLPLNAGDRVDLFTEANGLTSTVHFFYNSFIVEFDK